MNLNKTIHELEIWEDWSNSYQKYIPLFLDEAKTKNDWTEWDQEVWNEFFEKNRDQCVSSLQQGYFTNDEKSVIKDNWSSISPLLKKIAENQHSLDIETYQKISAWFRQYTNQNRKASYNRIIASLQPELLSTIVNEDRLNRLINRMNSVDGLEVIDNSGTWFEKSNRVLEYFKKQFPNKNVTEIATLPWQLYDFFEDEDKINNDMSETQTPNNKEIELLKYKKQIILQGPPGTGKTREAKLIAKEILGLSDVKELQNHPQFEIIQFHPSYSYEDFIEGLKPVVTKEKSINYETVSGSFKRFCEKAMLSCIDLQSEPTHQDDFDSIFEEYVTNLNDRQDPFYFYTKNNVELVLDSTNDGSITVKYRYSNREKTSPGSNPFVVSKKKLEKLLQAEINPESVKSIKAELFPITGHISGELFAVYRDLYSFMQSKQINISEVEVNEYDYEQIVNLYRLARENKTLNESQKYIFVIDEINRANLSAVLGELIYALEYRGEEVKSVYSPEDNSQLIIPPNLYIIGTMNTADRSVGHIDYAVKRRFAFIDILPENLKETQGLEAFDDKLFESVKTIFKQNLSADFEMKDVQLGHSYFIENVKEGGTMDIRLEYEIKPILREYVKDGILNESAKLAIDQLEVIND